MFSPLDAFGNPARSSYIEASTKSGKTVSGAVWLFEQALNAGGPGRNYWWLEPVYTQAEIAFRCLKGMLPRQIYEARNSPPQITLPNKATIWFKSGEEPDRLYGEDVWAAVVDEASRLREEAWHALRSTLTSTRGPVRCIGNVHGRLNWFYDLARKAETGLVGAAYYKIIAADAVKAGILADEEIEEARRDLPEQVFKELYLAEPSDDGGNPFGLKFIDTQTVEKLSGLPPVFWGWDLGKSVDWTVGIGLDRDGAVAAFERWQLPWKETISRIYAHTKAEPAWVDATGLGDPIVEELQSSTIGNFEGYKFTMTSKQQLMEGLAVGIQQGRIFFPVGQIVKELKMFGYEMTRIGVRYTAPEGAHDDCVCALALAVHCMTQNSSMEVWRRLGRQIPGGAPGLTLAETARRDWEESVRQSQISRLN